jgi:hypothetical protein
MTEDFELMLRGKISAAEYARRTQARVRAERGQKPRPSKPSHPDIEGLTLLDWILLAVVALGWMGLIVWAIVA